MEVAFQNLFGLGSDRGGFQAFSTSRLQLIQHNFAKGRPSGAPGFLARAKFLTFAFFVARPQRGTSTHHRSSADRRPTFASLVLGLVHSETAHTRRISSRSEVFQTFSQMGSAIFAPKARDPPRHIRVARDQCRTPCPGIRRSGLRLCAAAAPAARSLGTFRHAVPRHDGQPGGVVKQDCVQKPASAIKSSVSRRFSTAILLALPKAMNHAASQAAIKLVSRLFNYAIYQ